MTAEASLQSGKIEKYAATEAENFQQLSQFFTEEYFTRKIL